MVAVKAHSEPRQTGDLETGEQLASAGQRPCPIGARHDRHHVAEIVGVGDQSLEAPELQEGFPAGVADVLNLGPSCADVGSGLFKAAPNPVASALPLRTFELDTVTTEWKELRPVQKPDSADAVFEEVYCGSGGLATCLCGRTLGMDHPACGGTASNRRGSRFHHLARSDTVK